MGAQSGPRNRATRRRFRLLAATAIAGVIATMPAAAVDDPPSLLVSRQLAQSHRLSVGDPLRLATTADGRQARTFRVAGVYEPTPDPARLGAVIREVRMHLPDLLDLTRAANVPAGSEPVARINVALTDPGDASQFAKDVAARIPGILAQPATDAAGATGPFVVLERFHFAIASVTILASTVFLLALTIMLVDERRTTVGVLRLIGLPAGRILAQLFIEGVLIAVAGSLFGLLLALGSEGLINRFFQWRYDTALVFVRITPGVAAVCVAIAVPLGVAATVGAAWVLLRRSGLRLARR